MRNTPPPPTPEREALRARLAAALGTDQFGPAVLDTTDRIAAQLEEPELVELVTLVEAPAYVRQRIEAKLMLERVGSRWLDDGSELTVPESRTTTAQGQTR